MNVLVTGGNGQLASCIKAIQNDYPSLNFIFTGHEELDICDFNQVQSFFCNKGHIDYCINCAAYTAVDKAEKESDIAYKVNVEGAKNLAIICAKNKTILIHISTDFVFEGNQSRPYTESDEAKPISVYGETKLKGEKEIEKISQKYFIIRTSWLYSEHGHNFMKTMLRLAKERDEISVVNDQIGTPTYAGDLAKVVLHIINVESQNYGLYHYSNLGELSWFDFAKAIFEESKMNIHLIPIKTKDYPILANRPIYSVLDKSKINKEFHLEIPYWENSLKMVLSKYLYFF